MRIQGLVFETNLREHVVAGIYTIIPKEENNDTPCFPCFESVLGTSVPTQECRVDVVDHYGHTRTYLIAAQYDPQCEVNLALKEVTQEADWKGGLCVMRTGERVLVTNFRDYPDKLHALDAVRK